VQQREADDRALVKADLVAERGLDLDGPVLDDGQRVGPRRLGAGEHGAGRKHGHSALGP